MVAVAVMMLVLLGLALRFFLPLLGLPLVLPFLPFLPCSAPVRMVLLGPFAMVLVPPVARVPAMRVVPVAVAAPGGMVLGPFRMMLVHPLWIVGVPPFLVAPDSPAVVGAVLIANLPLEPRVMLHEGLEIRVFIEISGIVQQVRIVLQFRMPDHYVPQRVFGLCVLRESRHCETCPQKYGKTGDRRSVFHGYLPPVARIRCASGRVSPRMPPAVASAKFTCDGKDPAIPWLGTMPRRSADLNRVRMHPEGNR